MAQNEELKDTFMKKIYAIKSLAVAALAFMANVAMGQNLKVTSNGNPVADGDVIDLPYEVEVFSFPDMPDYIFYKAMWDPHLEAFTIDGTESVTVTLTSIDSTKEFQLCWPDGCQLAGPNESKWSSGPIDSTPQDLKIHKEVYLDNEDSVPAAGGTVTVKVASGTESITVTINALLQVDNAVGENFADINAKTVYYTLEGIQVENPTKGIYVARKGGKSKLIVK